MDSCKLGQMLAFATFTQVLLVQNWFIFILISYWHCVCLDRRKRDRERQERLARERIQARRQKSQSDLEKDKERLKELENDDRPVEVMDKTDVAALQVGELTLV